MFGSKLSLQRVPLVVAGMLVSTAAVTAAPASPQIPPQLVPVDVAEFELEVPHDESFIMHGTLPVPTNVFATGGTVPVKVELPNGTLVQDTQIEVVSRYPNSGSGADADVVEVIARVTRDPSWTVGQRVRYRLLDDAGGTAPTPPPASISNLINGPTSVPASIQGLLTDSPGNDPYAVAIVAEDPLGYRYVAYPFRGSGGMKNTRYGPVQASIVTYETFLPVGTLPAGTYPHMFGLHSYISTRSQDSLLLLDLRFNNGADHYDQSTSIDDPLGPIYFKKIDLFVTENAQQQWLMQQDFEDAFSFQYPESTSTAVLRGKTYRVYPLVKPMPPGGGGQQIMHMMPFAAQFHRRLVISPGAFQQNARYVLDQEGLAFAVKGTNELGNAYWSWWNPATARYFPQRNQLPTLSFTNGSYSGLSELRSVLTSRFNNLKNRLDLGQAFVWPDVGAPEQFGWAHPLGTTNEYEQGGQQIQFLEGDRALAAAHRDGYRYLQLMHRLQSERMTNAIFDRYGEPTYLDKWLYPAPGCTTCPQGPNGQPSQTPIKYGGHVDGNLFWDINTTNWTQNQYVTSNGLQPAYETGAPHCGGDYCEYNLNAYTAHWTSHSIRYTKQPLALIWIGNDPLAKDDVLVQAEMFRIYYTEYPVLTWPSASKLYSDNQWIAGNPNWCFGIGRAEGWGLNSANAAFAFMNDAWRARMRVWYDRVLDTMENGIGQAMDSCYISPSGLPYRWGILGAAYNDQFQLGQERGHQTWEEVIVQNGMRGMARTVYSDAEPQKDRVEDLLKQSYYGLLSPVSWNEAGNSLFGKVPVTPPYGTQPHYLYNCDPSSCACPAGSHPLPACCPPHGGEATHYYWASMAGGYELTQGNDPIFLERPLSNLGGTCGTSCSVALRNALQQQDPTDVNLWTGWSNMAVLLGVVQ